MSVQGQQLNTEPQAYTWTPAARAENIKAMSRQEWDVVVVGGGITGAGIYHEAASRGLKVLLVEQQDFAWGTSSRSSKMVHGGLRYLGSGQFSLANDSVKERQRLLSELPGLVNPLPFLMGHYRGGFPGPRVFNLILALYDWMAGKRYRRYLKQGLSDYWAPGVNQARLQGMTRFADAVTDDARLVLRVLHEGNRKGGLALNYLRAIDTQKDDHGVSGVCLEDLETQQQITVRAGVVINATGAWTDVLRQTLGQQRVIRPLRGSHVVVPFWRLPVSFSVSFFHPVDKRPVFVFPWEGVTVIGTTDLDHSKALNQEAAISAEELEYLLTAANHQFDKADLSARDALSTWSGVRPVVSKNQNKEVDIKAKGKPSDEKREHAIWNDQGLISVAGGKLTTYRLIALDVLRAAVPRLKGKVSLEGLASAEAFETAPAVQDTQVLSVQASERLRGRYGCEVSELLSLIEADSQQGQKISTTDTLWAELIWACQAEAVVHLDDLLLRRTRIGLLLPAGGCDIQHTIKRICCQYLAWDDAHWQQEWQRYQTIISQFYSLPSSADKMIETEGAA